MNQAPLFFGRTLGWQSSEPNRLFEVIAETLTCHQDVTGAIEDREHTVGIGRAIVASPDPHDAITCTDAPNIRSVHRGAGCESFIQSLHQTCSLDTGDLGAVQREPVGKVDRPVADEDVLPVAHVPEIDDAEVGVCLHKARRLQPYHEVALSAGPAFSEVVLRYHDVHTVIPLVQCRYFRSFRTSRSKLPARDVKSTCVVKRSFFDNLPLGGLNVGRGYRLNRTAPVQTTQPSSPSMNVSSTEEVISVLIDVCRRAASEDVSAEWSAMLANIESHIAESGVPHSGLEWAMIIQRAIFSATDISPHLAVLGLDSGLIHAVSRRVDKLSEPAVSAVLTRLAEHFNRLSASGAELQSESNGDSVGLLSSQDIVSAIPRWLCSAHSQHVLDWAQPIVAFVGDRASVLLKDPDEMIRCYAAIGLLAAVTDQRAELATRADTLRELMKSDFGELTLSGCVLPADLVRSVFQEGELITSQWAFLLVRQPVVLATPEWVASLAPLLSPTGRAGLPVDALERLNVPNRLELAAKYLDSYVLPSQKETNDLLFVHEFNRIAPRSLLTEDRLNRMFALIDNEELESWILDQLDALQGVED